MEAMSQNGKTLKGDVPPPPDRSTRAQGDQKQWFTTPSSIKSLFDNFPLRTYPPNELSPCDAQDATQHRLYIFTTAEGARLGSPSYNPSCLKWQAYLKFTGIQFATVSSTNHASPTGVLPFLIPRLPPKTNERALPLPAAKLQRWALAETSRGSKKAPASRDLSHTRKNVVSEQADSGAEVEAGERDYQQTESKEGISGSKESRDMRYDAYLSLLDTRIRNAWLHFLYLEPSNFAAVAYPLYITPCSRNFLVRTAIAHNLRLAARSELLKQLAIVNADTMYRECDKAFSALSQLLGDDLFFFASDRPGLFDASVFAYTNPLLDDGLNWQETRLVNGLRAFQNLVEHRQRISKRYFEESFS